ncbi:MAG: CRISPR-associated endonuclease Cas2 [Patescibacteria group bacterium]
MKVLSEFGELMDDLPVMLLKSSMGRMPLRKLSVNSRYWKFYHERAQTFYYLKKRRLITAKKDGDILSLALTKEGKNRLLELALLSASNILPNGTYCLVAFDIPETRRDLRREVRVLLRRNGFVRIQQSVWQTQRDAIEPLNRWIESSKLTKMIRVFLAKTN